MFLVGCDFRVSRQRPARALYFTLRLAEKKAIEGRKFHFCACAWMFCGKRAAPAVRSDRRGSGCGPDLGTGPRKLLCGCESKRWTKRGSTESKGGGSSDIFPSRMSLDTTAPTIKPPPHARGVNHKFFPPKPRTRNPPNQEVFL